MLIFRFWDRKERKESCSWKYLFIRIIKKEYNKVVLFITSVQDCSLLHSVQTGSTAQTASCPMGTRGYLLGGKVTRG
jgi:hypothetical protein